MVDRNTHVCKGRLFLLSNPLNSNTLYMAFSSFTKVFKGVQRKCIKLLGDALSDAPRALTSPLIAVITLGDIEICAGGQWPMRPSKMRQDGQRHHQAKGTNHLALEIRFKNIKRIVPS